jgi:hypothetical protein
MNGSLLPRNGTDVFGSTVAIAASIFAVDVAAGTVFNVCVVWTIWSRFYEAPFSAETFSDNFIFSLHRTMDKITSKNYRKNHPSMMEKLFGMNCAKSNKRLF